MVFEVVDKLVRVRVGNSLFEVGIAYLVLLFTLYCSRRAFCIDNYTLDFCRNAYINRFSWLCIVNSMFLNYCQLAVM